jgi:dihydroorotate dehydrogenase
LSPHVNALVMVNCISAKISSEAGELFDGNSRGIAGSNIYEAALAQIALFRAIMDEQQAPLRLVGVGGIGNAEQVKAHLNAGSHAVQLATAAMLDPQIGAEIRKNL